LDGSFPNTKPTPWTRPNLDDLRKKVQEVGADIGLAFDGDADRCFVIDEQGNPVPPSAIVALIATRELAKTPGAAVVYNVITSQTVSQIITELGGVPVRCRVGHSFMKATMAEHNAVFGGEHSGTTTSPTSGTRQPGGLLAALHVLAALGGTDNPCPNWSASTPPTCLRRDQQRRRRRARRTQAGRDHSPPGPAPWSTGWTG